MMLVVIAATSRQRAAWRKDNVDDAAPACSATKADCTQSLCCSNAAARCDRRPEFHHAQCRSEKAACVPWEERATAWNGSALWLCPGWEACASAGAECTMSRCCADEGFACYLNKSHHVGTIMGLTSNRSSGPKVHVNRSHHVLWFAQCRPVNRTVCATHHHTTPTHSQWLHAAAAATPQSSSSSAGRHLVSSPAGAGAVSPAGAKAGAVSPAAGVAQPAATAGAIPGLREAGRSHASAAALLHPGEWLCPSSWMAWEDELWIGNHPAGGSRSSITMALAIGAGSVAALGLCAVLLLHLLWRMQVRALLRLQAAEMEMAEVAERGRGQDRDRDRDRLLRLLHGHAEAARRHVRRLSACGHGYAAAPHGVQPASGLDSDRELEVVAAAVDEQRRSERVSREELLDPSLSSRDVSPALRSTSPNLAAGTPDAIAGAGAGAGAGAPVRTPSPAPLPRPVSRERSLWSLLLGGQ